MQDYLGEDHDEMRQRERADEQSEDARETLHAAIRFCPQCAVEVLTRRDKARTCLRCDTPTSPPGSVSPARLSSPSPAASAAGVREATNKP